MAEGSKVRIGKVLLYKIAKAYIDLKWAIFGDYYARLGVQARYLYRQSDLFKIRRQEMDMDFAEQGFENVDEYFFKKAKKEHIVIRGRIMLDSILGRPPQPYVMRGNV